MTEKRPGGRTTFPGSTRRRSRLETTKARRGLPERVRDCEPYQTLEVVGVGSGPLRNTRDSPVHVRGLRSSTKREVEIRKKKETIMGPWDGTVVVTGSSGKHRIEGGY